MFEETWRKLFQDFWRLLILTESIYQQFYVCPTQELKSKKKLNIYPRLRERLKNEPFTQKLKSHFPLSSFQICLGVIEGE